MNNKSLGVLELEEKQETYIQINDKYRITSDGRLNLILSEQYFKRDGKGRGAEITSETAWRDTGFFGAGLDSLIRRFNNNEFLETFAEVERGQDIIEALKEMRTYLDEREQRIYEHVKEHVTLQLKNVNAND